MTIFLNDLEKMVPQQGPKMDCLGQNKEGARNLAKANHGKHVVQG